MPPEEIERVKETGAVGRMDQVLLFFFFFFQVSLLNMVVKIGLIQKKPRLEKKWSWHSRLLRVSVSDIRNRKYKSPTAKVYLRKAGRPE